MNRTQRAARFAAPPLALAGAVLCWTWLQPSTSAAGLFSAAQSARQSEPAYMAAGGVPCQPSQANASGQSAASGLPPCEGRLGITDTNGAPTDGNDTVAENEMIPFLPAAAAYPVLATLAFGAAHAARAAIVVARRSGSN